MTASHERARAVLLRSIFLDDAEPSRIQATLDRAVPWPLVLALAQRHAVAPALAWTLEHHDLLGHVPVEVREHLIAVRVQNELQNHVLLDDLATVTTLLADAGLRAIPMKGAALLAGGHVPVAARHLDDIDLWMTADDARRGSEVLLGAGFQLQQRSEVTHHGHEHAAHQADHHLPGLVSPAGTLVELHVRGHEDASPDDDVTARSVDAFERAWAEAVPTEAQPALRLPTPVRLLDEVCIHVVEHHESLAPYWPRHLVDTACLLRRGGGARTGRVPYATAVSLEVLRGVRDDDAPVSALRAAAKLVLPVPERGLLAHARRALREGPAVSARTLWPARAYLEHKGYLEPGEPVVLGHTRRWRRRLGLS